MERITDGAGFQRGRRRCSLAWQRGDAGGGERARLRWGSSHERAWVFLLTQETCSPARRGTVEKEGCGLEDSD